MTISDAIDREERHDHALATARGQRLDQLARAIVDALVGNGLLSDPRYARVITFHVLADHLYGNAAIDIPTELEQPR
jgi:NAD(P)H-hydrate repair Nnr-like enzyme with NAD(P)H-hydrate epimerase domain